MMSPTPMEVIGSAALGTLLVMMRMMWREFSSFRLESRETSAEITTALLGFKGSGGIIAEVEKLKAAASSVDERIKDSRHEEREKIHVKIGEVQMNVLERLRDSEKRLHKRIDGLEPEAR